MRVSRFLAAAAALFIAVLPARADQILGPGRITGANKVVLPGGPTLGLWQGGKFTSQPDAIQIQGSGSTGDVSGMSVTPNAAAAAGTLSNALSPLVPNSTNPYAPGAFPYFASGIGSQYGGYTGYYDIKPLATSALYLPNGSATLFNPFTYGSLNTSGTLTLSTDVGRPGCVAGFTAPGQVAAYDELGSYGLCIQADSMPVMATVPGSFTATTFVPSSPIALSSTVKLGVGMWIRTDDKPAAYNGQITSWSTNTQGQVTSIAVSGWFQRGGGAAATPSGANAWINPHDKVWNVLNTLFLNGITFTGTTTAGSTAITNVSSTRGLVTSGQYIQGPGIPAGAHIVAIVGSTLYISQYATASSTGTITATAGSSWGKGVGEEMDITNSGTDFLPYYATDTANTTSGSYILSNITQISQWRSGVVIYGPGIPIGAVVVDVNIGNNTLILNMRATATASAVPIKATNQLDEGGTGLDIVGLGKLNNAGVIVRGGFGYSFLSHGAVDTAFLFRPDFDGGVPLYGFRSDGKLNGHASVCDFAVTDHLTNRWCVTGTGTVIEAVSAPPASSSAPCTTGQHAWDQNYEYRCVATNTWKRAALSAW
jgi:hypothetical protein